MPTVAKQNMFLYDEPAEYNYFNGGINNDPSNESLRDNELKDALNCHYNNGVLERRLGATVARQLEGINDLIQMAIIYTPYEDSYLIYAMNGKLYHSVITKDEEDKKDLVPTDTKILVDTTKAINDPTNVLLTIGGMMETDTVLRDYPHDGYVWTYDISQTNPDDSVTTITYNELVFQNKKPIEAVIIENEVRIATGTRYCRIYHDGEALIASIVEPEQPNSWDATHIGYNFLSPHPEMYVGDTYQLSETRAANIILQNHKTASWDTSNTFKVVADYAVGTTPQDYFYQWRWKYIGKDTATQQPYEWQYKLKFSENEVGTDCSTVTIGQFNDLRAGVIVECRIATEFSYTDGVIDTDPEYGDDWKVHAINGIVTGVSRNWTLKFDADMSYDPDYKFLEIHSCRKIFTDGNKVILYDDYDNSGNWYKSIVGKYNYITNKGQLNFKTSKDEQIIKAVSFDGKIVVFSNNEKLGGNISVVVGNGDDYDNGQYFSPYRRRIVSTHISCDHPNSVQIVENHLAFKYRNTIYLLDSRELDSEKVNLMAVNGKVSYDHPIVYMPDVNKDEKYDVDLEYRLLTEVTEDYYALIYPEDGMRWKLYYKQTLRYQDDPKIYIPWLRDEGKEFKVRQLVEVDNISTYITQEGKLIQYTNTDYKDEEDIFDTIITTKAFNLIYGKMVKFIKSMMIYYYRGHTSEFDMEVHVQNESKFPLIEPRKTAFIDYAVDQVIFDEKETYNVTQTMDKRALILNETELDLSILGNDLFTSRLYRPELRFPLLNAEVTLYIKSAQAFALNSITFNYETSEMPRDTLPKVYANIARRGDR